VDIAGRIQQLEELIVEAKSMPLSTSVLVNREEALELVQEMLAALPEEVKQARWVVKDREQLLGKARKDAEGIIQDALEQQSKLLAQEEVVKASVKEAERILEEARGQARQIRHEAEDYMDQKLAAFEAAITRTMEQIAQIKEANDASFGRIRDQLAALGVQVEDAHGSNTPPLPIHRRDVFRRHPGRRDLPGLRIHLDPGVPGNLGNWIAVLQQPGFVGPAPVVEHPVWVGGKNELAVSLE
jgi:vacuolar-type H+-ATPase subunit H